MWSDSILILNPYLATIEAILKEEGYGGAETIYR